jgi:predicted TIM-barrel fold metal-dependent hydrolase
MPDLNRRQFLNHTALAGAALALSRSSPSAVAAAARPASPGIIDTNVNLFRWPFRKLKYSDTAALVAKLRQHRVIEAWAGSYEALLDKDINGVNERLAAECRSHGRGLLRPIGSVNLAWPDWEEDVRRCHEVFKMPGLRIFPGYQPFDLGHPDLPRLLALTRERGLLLQIAFSMEDSRVHHPAISLGTVVAAPLIAAMKSVPAAKVQVLHFSGNAQGSDLGQLMRETSAAIDISRWEGNGMVGRMIGARPETKSPRVPIERALFGSHAPYFPLETAILKLIESPLDAAQLHAIMQGNARKLLAAA